MYQIISLAAVAAYFVPLLFVFGRKAWNDRFFLLFALYWAFGGISNIIDVVPGASKDIVFKVGVFYNMLDIPFILGILFFTTSYTFIRKTAFASILIIILIQVISIVRSGINYDALMYPLGIGVAMVLCTVMMEVIRYMQKVEHTNRQNAKMFIYAAVLFEYATFIVIYIFDYILTTEDRTDSFIIYYVSSLVAIFIATCGFAIFPRSVSKIRAI
jgi:hypothetical protein